MASIQIIDIGNSIKIITDGSERIITKNTIVRIEPFLNTKIRIIDNSGTNEYLYSDITFPVTASLADLVTSLSAMVQKKAVYTATIAGLVVSAGATDIFTIIGAANKNIKILQVVISGTRTTNGNISVRLLRRSSLNTGGTSLALNNVKFESTDNNASATVLAYTANPTLGTLVGDIAAAKLSVTSTGTVPNIPLVFSFEKDEYKQPALLSANELIALNLNGITVAGSNFDIFIKWSEE